jgi:hypothetical protein
MAKVTAEPARPPARLTAVPRPQSGMSPGCGALPDTTHTAGCTRAPTRPAFRVAPATSFAFRAASRPLEIVSEAMVCEISFPTFELLLM